LEAHASPLKLRAGGSKKTSNQVAFITPQSGLSSQPKTNNGDKTERLFMYIDVIKDILTKHARLPQDVNTLQPSDDLYEVGLTSLSTVNIMLALEDAFDIEFPDSKLNRKTFSSIESLEETITEILNR
jgi:acyl carrier protein